MKCILSDFRRAIAGRWFLAALIATIITIYLSVGRATYGLIGYLENIEMYDDSFWYSMSDLLALGMKGNFGMLTLPALSACLCAFLRVFFTRHYCTPRLFSYLFNVKR